MRYWPRAAKKREVTAGRPMFAAAHTGYLCCLCVTLALASICLYCIPHCSVCVCVYVFLCARAVRTGADTCEDRPEDHIRPEAPEAELDLPDQLDLDGGEGDKGGEEQQETQGQEGMGL